MLREVDVREIAHAAIDTAAPEAQERSITIALRENGPVLMRLTAASWRLFLII